MAAIDPNANDLRFPIRCTMITLVDFISGGETGKSFLTFWADIQSRCYISDIHLHRYCSDSYGYSYSGAAGRQDAADENNRTHHHGSDNCWNNYSGSSVEALAGNHAVRSQGAQVPYMVLTGNTVPCFPNFPW